MAINRPVTIIGGGLAGLTLGIGLRQRGVPVTVWEAGRYPRHRVCGEFINGRGLETLQRLDLQSRLADAGAIAARTAQFSTALQTGRLRELPQPALCLPRHKMDAIFADRFQQLGGELRAGERWHNSAHPDGVVLATGRRSQSLVNGWRWFGLKVHALNVATGADLEMHVSENGYVGLCRQPGGLVNVCGLFRRKSKPDKSTENWQEQLRGPIGSRLRARMDSAVFLADSFCAVAGISLKPRRARQQSECRIGDALTMIPPVTGNGMSMALESAEMAIKPLAAYSRGEIDWAATRQNIARVCDSAFARRLKWAGWLQHLLFVPALQNALVAASANEWFWRLLFTRTR
jgi:2-polyprenyl-6-methoxyphenol hydroxylase-like FAD-dependent oxidoreductase